MHKSLKNLALAGVLAVMATSASALSLLPPDSPLFGDEATQGNVVAGKNEAFSMATLSFTAGEAIVADVTITINPFLFSPKGTALTNIDLYYQVVPGGPGVTPIPVTQVPVGPAASIGGAFLSLNLVAGDIVTFFVDGVAGAGGNQVTFNIETAAAEVPIGASGFLLLSGFGALVAARRRKTATEI